MALILEIKQGDFMFLAQLHNHQPLLYLIISSAGFLAGIYQIYKFWKTRDKQFLFLGLLMISLGLLGILDSI